MHGMGPSHAGSDVERHHESSGGHGEDFHRLNFFFGEPAASFFSQRDSDFNFSLGPSIFFITPPHDQWSTNITKVQQIINDQNPSNS